MDIVVAPLTEQAVAARVAQIKRAWAALSLRTMTKAEFTDQQWRALARFSLDPNDQIARDEMPIMVAKFTEASREVALWAADQQKHPEYVLSRQQTHREQLLVPSFFTNNMNDFGVWVMRHFKREQDWNKRFKKLVLGIDADLRNISANLLASVDEEMYVKIGKFYEFMAGDMHQHLSHNGVTADLIGRINLPFQYIRGKVLRTLDDGDISDIQAARNRYGVGYKGSDAIQRLTEKRILETATDGGIYILPRKTEVHGRVVQGIEHCSGPIPLSDTGEPIHTPSLFVLQVMKPKPTRHGFFNLGYLLP